METPANRPTQQLFRQMFGEEQRLGSYADLNTYIDGGGSIFPLVEMGERGLIEQYRLSPDDARTFLRRGNSLAVYLRRRFIEHTLRGSATAGRRPSSGLLSMVAGPSYEQLFPTDFDGMSPPDALEACTSPPAYLVELLRWIDERIERSGSQERLPLHERRVDLKKLLVDFNSVYQSVSSVDLIVKVLEVFIAKHGKPVDLVEAMIQDRYPNGLPYYQHWVTLDSVARHHGLSIGDFVRAVDDAYPYFLQSQGWDEDAGRAMSHASRLGPIQRRLLTETAVDSGQLAAFYAANFGASGDDWKKLDQVPFLGERTKLDALGLEALLSVGEFAPTRSANVKQYEELPAGSLESGRSGSVYLNANGAPAVGIDYVLHTSNPDIYLHKLTSSPQTLALYDRLNRKVRLDHWLQLSPEEVDALLAAAMRAEMRHVPGHSWWINDAVVHALGLFQSLREEYGCSAQDFAAFIDGVSIYGRGKVLSQYDQVFNVHSGYRQPLVLDGGEFPTLVEREDTELTVLQLCSALAIDLQTYQYLAAAIAEALGRSTTLVRNRATISSFYRLVKLPRMLGMTPIEGIWTLTLLGGGAWLAGFAGEPRIKRKGDTQITPDVLNLIYSLHSYARWCRTRQLPVLWTLQHAMTPLGSEVESEAERQFFDQVRSLIPGAVFSDAGLSMAGVPMLPGASWLVLLLQLVDAEGLVLKSELSDAEYLSFARPYLDKAVRDGLGELDAATHALIVERMLAVLLQARDAQASVVRECLAVYAGVDAERVLWILSWTGSTVYRLLTQVLMRTLAPEVSRHSYNNEPDPLLKMLADVRRRSAWRTSLSSVPGCSKPILATVTGPGWGRSTSMSSGSRPCIT